MFQGKTVTPDPIFIIGHWRSGTTFLHHLMSRGDFGILDPVAAGLPCDSLGLGRLLRPLLGRLLPPDRLIDQVPVRLGFPEEDEIALGNMSPLAFHHALYFPRRMKERAHRALFFEGCGTSERAAWKEELQLLMGKAAFLSGGRRLLLKNPAHTARIRPIREVFPGAKFILVMRNPYEIFPSMRHFYDRLLDWLALEPFDDGLVDDLIFETYLRMMRQVEEDRRVLEDEDFVEVRFERLEADPLGEVARIYGQLRLEGFEAAEQKFRRQLLEFGGLRRNGYDLSETQRRLVDEHWGEYARILGYGAPRGR